MTFTRATLTKLRALNLPQDTVDAILEIFEDAHLSKPRKKGCAADREERGTRLAADWELPAEWREWAISIGVREHEIRRETTKFKNYWLNAQGARAIKLKWFLTWQNWCYSTLERAGREPLKPAGEAAAASGPETFTDSTWAAIVKRYKAGAPWHPDWGPPPGRMDCRLPVKYL